MKLWILAAALALAACGRPHKEQSNTESVKDLPTVYSDMMKAIKATSDTRTGWPSVSNCDGTLWAGLARSAGAPADLDFAEYEPGEIHRRPYTTGTCWRGYDVGSKSTVSRDMLIGYLWGRWVAKDLAALGRLEEYGLEHDWVMGQPKYQPEVTMGDNLKGILCRAINSLGGKRRECAEQGSVYLPVFKDYERHIQVLTILLDGEVTQGAALLDLSTNAHERLVANAEGSPDDGLFQAARGVYTGDQTVATELLTDSEYVCPTYVRDAPNYCYVHKAFAAWLVLKRSESQ